MTHGFTTAFIAAGVLLAILTACEAPAPKAASQNPPHAAVASQTYADRPLAFVNGEPITAAELHASMLEAIGGQTLAEWVLDRMLQQRLSDAGLSLTPEQLAAEQALLVDAFDSRDADEAARLLREVRRRRGLGETRFTALLRRNAAMRALVQKQVSVTDESVRRAYDLTYGEQYVARLIVVPSLQDAARLRGMLQQSDVSFADLAVKRSTDPSAVQGGLLPPISPVDEEVPKVIRDTLVAMDRQGQNLSDVVALPTGYALLQMERKEAPESVEFTDVKDELAATVRQSAERVLMRQLARELLAAANVAVLDPALAESWSQQKDTMLGNP